MNVEPLFKHLLAVDESAVRRVQVLYEPGVSGLVDFAVVPGDRGVIEHDIVIGLAPHGETGLVQLYFLNDRSVKFKK